MCLRSTSVMPFMKHVTHGLPLFEGQVDRGRRQAAAWNGGIQGEEMERDFWWAWETATCCQGSLQRPRLYVRCSSVRPLDCRRMWLAGGSCQWIFAKQTGMSTFIECPESVVGGFWWSRLSHCCVYSVIRMFLTPASTRPLKASCPKA